MISERLTLGFCVLALVTGAACALLHFSPVWIAVPMFAAIASSLRTPVRSLLEMFLGGRR